VTEIDARETHVVRWGPLRLDVEPGVYGTVVLMTVLVVALDDGIADFAEAAQVVLGPLLATAAAHLFAAALARASSRSGAPTGADIRYLAADAAQFLVLAVVPLLVVAVGAVGGLYTPEDAVDLILWLGFAFLVVIGGVGGRRATRSVWGALAGALAAGVLGLFVLILRLVLEH